MMRMVLSPLAHTWLIDLDGTIVTHNGHHSKNEVVLSGVEEFWRQIPSGDSVVILTARSSTDTRSALKALRRLGLRFDRVVYDLPTGERILINDKKPSGLETAIAVNVDRDLGLNGVFVSIDPRI